MTRRSDWVSRLQAYVRANAAREFEYGVWDCALFAAGAIEEMTGRVISADFVDTYYSAESGRELLASRGGIDAVMESLQLMEVPLLRAQRGDLVLRTEAGSPMFGIVGFSGREVLVICDEGLTQVDVKLFQRAWRV